MLAELHVRDLGLIEDVRLVLGPGLTALTGETGAGKSLLVEAIDLLLGGRADGVRIRAGASEAVVEGRFVDEAGDELVLARVVPTGGRSRAYVDGHMATAGALAERGALLVDVHGQHAHESLLHAAAQRVALDRFAGLQPLVESVAVARAERRAVDEALSALGGDARGRARELDLVEFQLSEIAAAGINDAEEERSLEAEEEALADVVAHREAGATAHDALSADGAALDALRSTLAALGSRAPFAAVGERVRAALAELEDAAADLRHAVDGLADDPERLEAVRARQAVLRDLRRKYGNSLAEVLDFAGEAERRREELRAHDERAAALEGRRAAICAQIDEAEAALGRARRDAAPALGRAIETHLRRLALPHARFDVAVGGGAGEAVVFQFAANAGEPALPLAKVASGGELSRTMLAARLVLAGGPATTVFDEVDTGIGGEAARAVGEALAALAASGRQVLVVTHLAQVAAFADEQVAVRKDEAGGRTVATASRVAGDARVIELSRMLSGQPDSDAARRHAAELLAAAGG